MLTSTRRRNDFFRRKTTMREILFRGKNVYDNPELIKESEQT